MCAGAVAMGFSMAELAHMPPTRLAWFVHARNESMGRGEPKARKGTEEDMKRLICGG